MEQRIAEDIEANEELVKEPLKGESPEEKELKNNFRLRVEIQSNLNRIAMSNGKDKTSGIWNVNDWLSLATVKTSNEYNPISLNVRVNVNGSGTQELCHFSKFSDIFGTHIKNYLREVLHFKISIKTKT